jgi:hypothetical protein
VASPFIRNSNDVSPNAIYLSPLSILPTSYAINFA